MFFWIYDIPNWILAVLFSVFFVGFTCLGILLTRSYVRRWLGPPPGSNDLVSYVLSSFGLFYGIMLGLVTVETDQNFSQIEKQVVMEATTLGTLYQDVSGYPEPAGGEMKALLQEYGRYVIEEEWPAQQNGIVPDGGRGRILALHRKLIDFQPQTAAQEILHAEAYRKFNEFFELRRLRLHSVTSGLAPVLWTVVIIGAFLSILLMWLLSVERLSIHLVLAGIVSLFIGLVIFLIAAMDYPFRGEYSVSPEAFVIIYKNVMLSLWRF